MSNPRLALRRSRLLLLSIASFTLAGLGSAAETGLLFKLTADQGTTADFSAGGTSDPTFKSEVTVIPDGAQGPALSCGNLQRLAWKAPGNIYAQRGTLSFFWRSRYPVGPTEFPVFRVGYAEHSSWDMVWLRIDYNGHGFDAFVTDASLARTRVSVALPKFPAPSEWVHLALAWDETRGIRFFINGQLAAEKVATAVYNAALDQFGPHSRIISPHNVQSDYNFVRGGDIDEIRIYDRMLDDSAVAALAKGQLPAALPPLPERDLAQSNWRDEWALRYGWNRAQDLPPLLPGAKVSVRKVEIHDAYDLKRWWWKATDGIRETTWPGVYNRSRLPGRHDYFELPDWDCYSLSGKSITFVLPDEPWNHLEISGAAWGRMELLPAHTENESASEARAEALLFERPQGQEKTVHRMDAARTGGKIRFTNVAQETPIGELAAYQVSVGSEPAGSRQIALRLTAHGATDAPSLVPLQKFIRNRHPADEQASMVAVSGVPAVAAAASAGKSAGQPGFLPLVHILVPDTWDDFTDGLDGIALDLPALKTSPAAGGRVSMNIRVKDPLWPLRELCDFTFSVKPGEAHTLWLDLRDRLLPPGKALYLTIASADAAFGPDVLEGAALRLVFKSRDAARPEHELDRFTQARDSYAMLVEEHPFSPKFDLWVRFETDLKDLLRVNPDHVLGRQYAAIGMGSPAPAFVQPVAPEGVPLWAFRQVQALAGVEYFANWWVDHRQISNGEFGGGLSDDTDLTNLWPGIALMGASPEKLTKSVRAELEACYAQGMFTRGLPTIQADELHSYEEGINSLGENLIIDCSSPRLLERAMETARGVESITGINAAGHRHFRSSYYNGKKMAEEEPWGYTKAFSYLVLQPGQLLVDYNGSPAVKQTLLELTDGLLAHRHDDGKGGHALPTAINFKTDADSTATRGYFSWPLFWNAWQWTQNRAYLAPILDGGASTIMSVNANAFDLLQLRDTWAPKIKSSEPAQTPTVPTRPVDGRGSPRPNNDRASQRDHFVWQLSGRKSVLESLYGVQIEDMALGQYINTEGSLWIDRVGVPTTELQRARLGGVALARNATFPGHTVSWKFHAPAVAESLAILIPDATTTSFKVITYNLETTPVKATLTGANVDPGLWEITQGIDTDGDDAADQAVEARTVVFERTRSVELTFAPRATTVLTFKLKTPGTPYWQRPDLGIESADVKVQGREIHVTVHSVGSVPAPAADLVFRDHTGKVVAQGAIPALAAPIDLQPKTAEVILTLPANAVVAGGTVEIEPGRRFEEITERNNVVKL